MTDKNTNEGEGNIKINRGKIESLDCYEVAGYELDMIESGYDGGLFLNLGIALISIAFSFLTTILTSYQSLNSIVFQVFLVLTCIGFVGAIILFAMWIHTKKNRKKIFERIRNRLSIFLYF